MTQTRMATLAVTVASPHPVIFIDQRHETHTGGTWAPTPDVAHHRATIQPGDWAKAAAFNVAHTAEAHWTTEALAAWQGAISAV